MTAGGVLQPGPAPRFSRTPAELPGQPPVPGAEGATVLRDWGLGSGRIEQLRRSGALR